jgi:hypothetical protein
MVTARMEPDLVTDRGLLGILAALKQREPLSYALRQGDRVTRRLTVWQGSEETAWKVLYHQGTVVR